MNSFLFQKEQINCNCFDSSPKTDRRIFRSESYHSSTNNTKQSKQLPIRNQSEQPKHKKKSLKKQKQFLSQASQKDIKQKEQLHNNIIIPQLPINSSCSQYKKQQRIISFQNYQVNKQIVPTKYERSKPSHTLRVNRTQNIASNDLFKQVPPSNNDFASQNNLKINSHFQPTFYTHQNIYLEQKHHSQNEYENIISRQFQKDLQQYKIQMQKKIRPQQKSKNQIDRRTSIERHKDDKNHPVEIEKRQQKNKTEFKQKDKNEQKINWKSRKQSTSANKTANQKFLIDEDDVVKRMSAIEFQQTPVKHNSFRGSAVSQKQKQSISKKMKGRMLPKEIQSERDGSSSSSDQLSEVLGRGWDGQTEQRIQLEQLQEMSKRQKLNSQTMVTQQSHIKNSQIKTFTEYSNSFISPKSQYSKGFPFGGGHKYGITGMSYHQIQQFSKQKDNRLKWNV